MSKPGELRIDELLKNLDVDGDGDIDEEDKKLGETLKAMDKDGDGTITLRELVNIGQSKIQDQKKIRNLKKMVVAVIFAAVAFCGIMLGLMVAANEASKDSKPEGTGELKTIDGKDVSTTSTVTALPLAQLPTLPPAELEKLDTLTINTDEGIQFYQISGWLWMSTTRMRFYTTRGDTIQISDGIVTILTKDGRGVSVSRHRRSLLQMPATGPGDSASVMGSFANGTYPEVPDFPEPGPADCSWHVTAATCMEPCKFDSEAMFCYEEAPMPADDSDDSDDMPAVPMAK